MPTYLGGNNIQAGFEDSAQFRGKTKYLGGWAKVSGHPPIPALKQIHPIGEYSGHPPIPKQIQHLTHGIEVESGAQGDAKMLNLMWQLSSDD